MEVNQQQIQLTRVDAVSQKYSSELEEAKKSEQTMKDAEKIAFIWYLFWSFVNYGADAFIFACSIVAAINNYTGAFSSKNIAIINTVSLVAKTLETLLQAGTRATVARVLKDNYNQAASMINSKITDLTIIEHKVSTNNEAATWDNIKRYIDTMSNLAKSWPSAGSIQVEKVASIQAQLSKSIFGEKQSLQQQADTINNEMDIDLLSQ